jgi:hypothetical protein
MATVPSSRGPQVRTQPLQYAPQQAARSDAAFGGVQGRQLEALGQGAQQFAVAMERAANTRAQAEAFEADSKIANDWIQWDDEARTRFRGQNVGGYAAEAKAWWAKAVNAHAGSLSEDAKSMLEKSITQRRLRALDSVGSFTAVERERHADEAYVADVGATIRFGLRTGTPDSTIEEVRNRVAGVGLRKGWTTDQIEGELVRQLNPMHEAVLRNLIQSGNSRMATTYLEKHKDGLTEQLKTKMVDIVREASENETAENAAEEAWTALGPRGDNDPVKLFDMEQRIRGALKGKPEAMGKAIASLRQRAQAINTQQAETKAANVSAVWKMLDGGGSLGQVTRSPEWMALGGTEQRGIRRDIEAEAATRASRQASEAAREVSALQRNEQLNLLRNADEYLTATDPNTLSKMSRAQVEALRGRFGTEATKQLLAKWDELRKPGKLIEAKMDKQDFDTVADSLGLKPYASKSESESRKLGQLQYRVEQLIDQHQTEGKRPLTRQEKSELMRQEMARTVVVDGFWSDSTVPVIQLSTEQAARVVVPAGERAKVVQALQEMYRRDPGNPDYAPTEENVRRTYLRAQSRSADLIGR